MRQQLVVLSTRLEKYESQCQEKYSCSNPAGSENQAYTSTSVASDQPSLSTPLFGLPTITIPAPSTKPEAQLHQRNILWTSVTSAGQRLPLPLDSCCSVSLVSKVHADFIASKRSNLKYCPLEEPISVTAADPKSTLKAVATMEIPITWETKTETLFTMLVVPGLVWPTLFGENHLHATQALVDHYGPSITFRHPSMQFRVQCSLDNPLEGFTNSPASNGTLSHEGGPTVPRPHVSITCLLTGAPPLGVHKHSHSIIYPYISYAILAWGSAYKSHIKKIQTKQNHAIRLIFFARTLGKSTESVLPLLYLLDVLTVNNIYRLHILKFTHLWHKGLLPVLFQSYFQYASSIHGYNTRYVSKQNLYKPKERTNSGKQTVAFAASVLWDNIPVDLKSLNVFNFQKKN